MKYFRNLLLYSTLFVGLNVASVLPSYCRDISGLDTPEASVSESKVRLQYEGFDPASETSLHQALQSKNAMVVSDAIQVLVVRNDRSILPILEDQLKDKWAGARYRAAESLFSFKIDINIWLSTALQLLEDPDYGLLAAKLLARADNSEGWPIVKARLSASDIPTIWNATDAAQYFVGLKDKITSKPIDVLSPSIAAFRIGNKDTQLALLQPIRAAATPGNIMQIKSLLKSAKDENVRRSLQLIIVSVEKTH